MTQSLFAFADEAAAKTEIAAAAPKTASSHVTTGTAARMLGVSQWTVERLCEDGTLAAWRIKASGWWRIDFDSLKKLLRERREALAPRE